MKRNLVIKINIFLILGIFFLAVVKPSEATHDNSGIGANGWNAEKKEVSSCWRVTVNVRDSSGNLIVPDFASISLFGESTGIWLANQNGQPTFDSGCIDSPPLNSFRELTLITDVKKSGYHDYWSNNFSFENPTTPIHWTRDIYMRQSNTEHTNVQISPALDSSRTRIYYSYIPPFTSYGQPFPGATRIDFAVLSVIGPSGGGGHYGGVWNSATKIFTMSSPTFLSADGNYLWGSYLVDNLGYTSGYPWWSEFGLDRTPPNPNCSVTTIGNNIRVALNPTDSLSGVFSGQVRYRVNGGAYQTTGLPSGGNTISTFNFPGEYGNTYIFEFRARDNAVGATGAKEQWSDWAVCGTGTPSVPPEFGQVETEVKQADTTGSCTAGVPVDNVGVSLNWTGKIDPSDPSPPEEPHTGLTGVPPEGIAPGKVQFGSLSNGVYQLSITNIPSGFGIVRKSISPLHPSDASLSNGYRFILNSTVSPRYILFCIGTSEPWFQTTLGDVRDPNLKNLVPSLQKGSAGDGDENNPGIFFSSKVDAVWGLGDVSKTNWKVNEEYRKNAKSESKRGTFSYSFFEAKAKQEGVAFFDINSGSGSNLDWSTIMPEVSAGKVIRITGNIDIGSPPSSLNFFNATSKRRAAILVNGDVKIEDNIRVPADRGLLIIASKQDINVEPNVLQIDGYYSAEGSIVINSDPSTDCSALPETRDQYMIVEGALIANADLPFAQKTDTDRVFNRRTLCSENVNGPALLVRSRLDFLTQLTDFYKTTYSKWTELKP